MIVVYQKVQFVYISQSHWGFYALVVTNLWCEKKLTKYLNKISFLVTWGLNHPSSTNEVLVAFTEKLLNQIEWRDDINKNSRGFPTIYLKTRLKIIFSLLSSKGHHWANIYWRCMRNTALAWGFESRGGQTQ